MNKKLKEAIEGLKSIRYNFPDELTQVQKDAISYALDFLMQTDEEESLELEEVLEEDIDLGE